MIGLGGCPSPGKLGAVPGAFDDWGCDVQVCGEDLTVVVDVGGDGEAVEWLLVAPDVTIGYGADGTVLEVRVTHAGEVSVVDEALMKVVDLPGL